SCPVSARYSRRDTANQAGLPGATTVGTKRRHVAGGFFPSAGPASRIISGAGALLEISSAGTVFRSPSAVTFTPGERRTPSTFPAPVTLKLPRLDEYSAPTGR